MRKLLRKLRGLLGIGLTWGTLWAGIGAAIGAMLGIVSPAGSAWTTSILERAVGMGLYGLVSGVGFGALLSVGEGRKTILHLSPGRAAVWGALGSATVPLLFGWLGAFEVGTSAADVIWAVFVTGLLGGTFARGAVVIARKAELQALEERGLLGLEPSSNSL